LDHQLWLDDAKTQNDRCSTRMKIHALAVVFGLATLVPSGADSPAGIPAISPNATGATPDEKLKSIVLSVNFYQATLAQATNFLRVESKRLDPDHQGFSVVISPDAATSAKTITLELDKVPLEQALKSVGEIAGVKYRLEGSVLHFLSFAENPEVAAPVLPPDDKAAAATMHKLETIVIDKVNFDKLDIATVIRFLAAKSKELDPNHVGVNFVLGNISPTDHVHREVSMTLDNIPLSDLLQELKAQTNLNYSVGDNIVTFKP